MNDNQLTNILAYQRYDYTQDFATNVLEAINKLPKQQLLKIQWFLTGVAASLLLCAAVVYLQDGQLSFDAFLGINSLDNETLNEITIIQ